jgi:hypothetical protein
MIYGRELLLVYVERLLYDMNVKKQCLYIMVVARSDSDHGIKTLTIAPQC